VGLFDRIKYNGKVLRTKQFSEPWQRTFSIVNYRLINQDGEDVNYHGCIVVDDRVLLFTHGEMEEDLSIDDFKKTYPLLWDLI